MSALRSAVCAAIDALEAGDSYGAVEILLNALEDGPAEEHGPVLLRAACRVDGCGRRYEWPGLRDAHEIVDHGFCDEEIELDRAA